MTMQALATQSIDSPAMRQAGKDLLSLALMDARNHTLHTVGLFEKSMPGLQLSSGLSAPEDAALAAPLWLLGHVGWFQEWWIGRNTQRGLGELCPAQPVRLASIEPRADGCWNPALSDRAERWAHSYPSLPTIRAYLLETLESSLELLEKSDDSDADLYVYRLALAREDLVGEQLMVLAQALGITVPVHASPVMASRQPLRMPATRWPLGTPEGGFAWDNERGVHLVQVPEFEIDAQPVSWAQYVEFIDDGGYDEAAHWSPQGWDWLQACAASDGRRSPRYVEQIGVASGAVLQTRFGSTQRVAGGSSAMHVTWYEAQAYAAWAGRRVATEVEWDIAAHKAQGMGFKWGDVWEWTANTFRAYPGFVAGPWASYSSRHFERCKVLRGASWATRARMKQPSFRGFAPPASDAGFYGFRTCAA